MSIDPREQARAYEEARVEGVPKPDMSEDRREVRQAPEAVAVADATKRKDTTVEAAATDEITDTAEAAAVERKFEDHRARGVEWVRPTDLVARNTASLAGRGIDMEVEMSRMARAPLADGLRNLGDRARQLSPLSAFGHTRQTIWPGEDEAAPIEDTPIENRDEDFVAFVIADVERRRQIEHDFYASLNPDTGELA